MHDEAVLEYIAEKGNRRNEAVEQLTDQAVSKAAEVMAQLRAAAAGLDCVLTWTQSAEVLVSSADSADDSYSAEWCRKGLDPASDSESDDSESE